MGDGIDLHSIEDLPCRAEDFGFISGEQFDATTAFGDGECSTLRDFLFPA
jgi:hypothetical protein